MKFIGLPMAPEILSPFWEIATCRILAVRKLGTWSYGEEISTFNYSRPLEIWKHHQVSQRYTNSLKFNISIHIHTYPLKIAGWVWWFARCFFKRSPFQRRKFLHFRWGRLWPNRLQPLVSIASAIVAASPNGHDESRCVLRVALSQHLPIRNLPNGFKKALLRETNGLIKGLIRPHFWGGGVR